MCFHLNFWCKIGKNVNNFHRIPVRSIVNKWYCCVRWNSIGDCNIIIYQFWISGKRLTVIWSENTRHRQTRLLPFISTVSLCAVFGNENKAASPTEVQRKRKYVHNFKIIIFVLIQLRSLKYCERYVRAIIFYGYELMNWVKSIHSSWNWIFSAAMHPLPKNMSHTMYMFMSASLKCLSCYNCRHRFTFSSLLLSHYINIYIHL